MTDQRRCSECRALLRAGAEVCSVCGLDQPADGDWAEQPTRREKQTAGLTATVRIGTRDDFADAPPLVLPDGGPIVIGRETPGEIGDALDYPDERFGDVSRKHLMLRVDGYQVVVTDKSALGSYVDEVKLRPDYPERFPIPLDIRLAGRCWMRIERAD